MAPRALAVAAGFLIGFAGPLLALILFFLPFWLLAYWRAVS